MKKAILTEREIGIIKKIVAGLCLSAILVVISGIYACNKEDRPSDGLEFQLNGSGDSYSVSGIGTCKDAHVVIPDVYEDLPVTAIGASAFLGASLKSVTIPEGVTTIGHWAFKNCKSLTTVTIPEGVTTIGSNAFYECDRLSSIKLPSTLTSIGTNAFFYCGSLSELVVPNNVLTIGDSAFEGCFNASVILLGNSVKSIGTNAFGSCWSLRNLTIPENVARITAYVFEDCRALTNLTIPKHVSSIAEWAFQGCNNLSSITYGGTKADWAKMLLEPSWRADSAITRVVCSDGIVELPTE